MIHGQDILCFAPGPWDDIWRNRHQIMTRLARANRILYVEPWPYLYPTLRDVRAGRLRVADLGPRLVTVNDRLHVYRPPRWAPRATGVLGRASQAVYEALLRRELHRLGFGRPILWLFLPDMQVFVGRFDESLVIYHVVDEYSGYTGVSDTWRPVMQRMEEDLARRADLVFVTSPALFQSKRVWNERTSLVPNGVDYAAFKQAVDAPAIPEDVRNLSRPIAGYVGAINDKVDLTLLCHVAQEHADWTLLLVGPVTVAQPSSREALQRLRGAPNVHFLGVKSVDQVPHYIAACDVCLLPYRMNEWTRNIDSLKLYEYLACGRPVVASAVPAAEQFTGIVRIAADEEEFVAQIRFALYDNSPAQRLKRQSIAAQNTWDERVERLSRAISSELANRGRGELLEREA